MSQSAGLKILVISTDYPPMKGGISVLSHATALEFHRAGHDVSVVASCEDWQAARQFDRQQPFRTVRFSGKLLWRELQIFPACWREIRRFKPDVIWSALWYPCAVAASYCVKRNGPLQTVSTYGSEIFIAQSDWKVRLKARMGFWRRRVFDRCAQIFALSRYTREKIIELGAPPEKIDIVRGGVERGWFDLAPAARNQNILLTVARLDEHKGHDRVIEALPTVAQRYPDLKYVLVGPGGENWPRLQKIAQDLKVDHMVEYRGAVPFGELQKAYQEANVFIMASREMPNRLDLVEGFGLTFLEAATVELPSIAGNSGGVPDAVEHDVSGLLVDPDSPAALAEAILTLLDNPEYATRLGRQGRQRAWDEFRWETLAGLMLSAFEKRLEERKAARV